jgi:hypothetical protein
MNGVAYQEADCSLHSCTSCWGQQQKNTLKCAVLSHNTMPQMSQVLMEPGIGMLTAGMSTRAVARQFSVHFSTIPMSFSRISQYIQTASQLHIRLHYLRDRLRPATQTADETEEYFCL